MRSILVFVLVITLYLGVDAYVLQTDRNTRGRIVSVKWSDSRALAGIPFTVDVSKFPQPEADVVRIARKGFDVWQAVSTAFIRFDYRGTTPIPASSTDRRNVITYDATGRTLGAPAGSGIIAITRVNWDDSGEITDADIIFNGRDFTFSVDENSTPNRQIDLQDVMTHEIGHFFGLDHTPLVGSPTVRPTMNPFNTAEAPREGRSLELDDIASITALYPSAEATQTGGISGQVLRHDGTGAFGVHVVAYRANTTDFVASSLSGSAGSNKGRDGDGRYEILGLPPGDYHVAIEPHHPSISYENFGGIFGFPFDDGFDAEFYDNASLQSRAQLVRVAAGGTLANIDFALGSAAPGAPSILASNLPVNTPDPNGPYRFEVQVTDNVRVASVALTYRINEGNLQTVLMTSGGGDLYTAEIAGQSQGSIVAYRVVARDGDGNETTMPASDLPMLRLEVLALSGAPVAYVAARSANVLAVLDTGSGKEVARIPTGETPLSVLMTPDERYLFVANTGTGQNTPDNRITVIDAATYQVVTTLEVGTSPLDLAVSPDGRFVYVTNSQSGNISVIDVQSLQEQPTRLRVATTGDGPYGLAVSADGNLLYITDIDAGQVLALNAQTGAVQARVDVVASPRSLVMSVDGLRLYVAGFDGDISVVNTQTQVQEQVIDTGNSSIFRLAPSPDGTRLYATDRLNAALVVVDLTQNRVTDVVSALSGGLETRDLFVSPDGERVYVTNQDSDDLVVFDASTLRIVRTYRIVDGPRGVAVRSRPYVFSSTQAIVLRADFDGNGAIGFGDFVLFATAFGVPDTDSRFDARFDLDDDNRVNFSDFILFAGVFGQLATP